MRPSLAAAVRPTVAEATQAQFSILARRNGTNPHLPAIRLPSDPVSRRNTRRSPNIPDRDSRSIADATTTEPLRNRARDRSRVRSPVADNSLHSPLAEQRRKQKNQQNQSLTVSFAFAFPR